MVCQIPPEAEPSLNFIEFIERLGSFSLKTALCPGMSNTSPEFNIAAEMGAKIEIWNQTEPVYI